MQVYALCKPGDAQKDLIRNMVLAAPGDSLLLAAITVALIPFG